MRVKDFNNFIVARERVRERKEAGQQPPWIDDRILQNYRFCNVRREDDKVTRWINDNWRTPLGHDPDLWFWMLVARLVNNPDTLMRLNFGKWNEEKFIKTLELLQINGIKTWGGAYIVSTNGVTMPKAQYIAKHVLTPAWGCRKLIRPRQHDSLYQFCCRLLTLNGVQGFIAGQVIADAKYADEDLFEAVDWDTFAISGPGSRRGLNRVYERPVDAPWKEDRWHEHLSSLRETALRMLPKPLRDLHAQDIQNCLCEFDKYERVRLGEGKPRATYKGY